MLVGFIVLSFSVYAGNGRRVQTTSEHHLSSEGSRTWLPWDQDPSANHAKHASTSGARTWLDWKGKMIAEGSRNWNPLNMQALAEGSRNWLPWNRDDSVNANGILTIPIAEQKVLQKARGDGRAMKRAYESFKTKLDTDPDNLGLKLACAEAVVSMMRAVGDANSLTCHYVNGRPEIRKSDTAENKAFWSKWSPVADKLLSDIEKDVGKETFNKEGLTCSMKLETCMYSTSTRGIVSAALSGHASAFLGNLAKLEELHPKWDGSQPYIYRGSYYLAAPWPIHDSKKGAKVFEKSIKEFPSSRRNHYFVGVGRFANGDFSGARKAMEKSLVEPCRSQSELDICAFLSREAKRTVEMLSDAGY